MFTKTRLENSTLWRIVRPLYEDPRRHYHTMDGHLARMYAAWERFGWGYDADLDAAVLAHDAIIDPHGHNEARSAQLLLAFDPHAGKASDLVMSTVDHVPLGDWRLVALDLADFLDEAQTRENSRLLLLESKAMGNHADTDARIAHMAGYLTGLAIRLHTSAADPTTPFGAIRQGIQDAAARLQRGIV